MSSPVDQAHPPKRIIPILISLSFLYAASQFLWLGRWAWGNVNPDSVSYIGIARHVRAGEFFQSLNGYWSPLFPWLIALLSYAVPNFTVAARLITTFSFVLSTLLVFFFAKSFWQSSIVAATAVAWFVATRGTVAVAAESLVADFVFAALVICYFAALLEAFRHDRPLAWSLVGLFHALAFLAKAFALPWLAVTTVFAVLLYPGVTFRRTLRRLIFSAFIPVIIWVGWCSLMDWKYGHFMTGYQFRQQVLQFTLREQWVPKQNGVRLFLDRTPAIDRFAVIDPIPPGSPQWDRQFPAIKLLPQLILNEARNIPNALRASLVIWNPAAWLAIAACLWGLYRNRARQDVQFRLTIVALTSFTVLVAAYCLLVFDERYLMPITPIIIAIASRTLVPSRMAEDGFPDLRFRPVILSVLAITVFALLFHVSSPFRRSHRDYQTACYSAGEILSRNPGRFVSIGTGPFPEHGVGWEAGLYSAYFGRQRLVGTMGRYPLPTEIAIACDDLKRLGATSVLLWGRSNSSTYKDAVALTKRECRLNGQAGVFDSELGEVGTVLWLDPAPPQNAGQSGQ